VQKFFTGGGPHVRNVRILEFPMPTPAAPDDITQLIRRVETGDAESASELWNYCFTRLQAYCRRKLPSNLRRILDEEDIALSAFKSFCLGAQEGKFGPIDGRDEFWKLLYCIAARKAGVSLRYQQAIKRGGRQVTGESAFLNRTTPHQHSETAPRQIEQVAEGNASPVSIEAFLADCEDLFELLDTDELRIIAMMRVEGYSVDEIAERIGCAKRSVERRLNLIRQIWKSAFEHSD